jgi:hypothetical protein
LPNIYTFLSHFPNYNLFRDPDRNQIIAFVRTAGSAAAYSYAQAWNGTLVGRRKVRVVQVEGKWSTLEAIFESLRSSNMAGCK